MHLALLPRLILTLAWGASGGALTHQAPADTVNINYSPRPLFAIMAQTTTTSTVPVIVPATATLAITPTVAATIATAGTITGTGTGAISATATVSSAISTPIPVPTVAAPSNLQGNPLDANFLTSAPSPPMGPFSWAYLVIMALLFAASAYFYFYKRPEWKRNNTVLYKAAGRWGQPGLLISGLGLLFLLFRVISLDFFNLRFWLYLWFLAAIALAVWFSYWYRATYPKELARYQKTQRARQYVPGGARKGSARQDAAARKTQRNTTLPVEPGSRVVIAPTNRETQAQSVETSPTTSSTAQPRGKKRRKRH